MHAQNFRSVSRACAGPASQQIAARLRDSGMAHAEKVVVDDYSPSASDRSDSEGGGASESEDEGQDGYRRGEDRPVHMGHDWSWHSWPGSYMADDAPGIGRENFSILRRV